MTTVEVERKYRLEHDAVRPALTAADFTRRDRVEQVDRYFAHPNRPFAITDEALRIREQTTADGVRSELTYKGPQRGSTAKSRPEWSVVVDDRSVLEQILVALGFEAVASVSKARERFERGDVTVVLDDVEGLGEFVEIELLTDRAAIESAESRVAEVTAELGLESATQVQLTYLGLLLNDAQE